MKLIVNEYGGCFELSIEPETLDDAKMLVRIGLNSKKGKARAYSDCFEKSGVCCSIVLPKTKRDNTSIRSRP